MAAKFFGATTTVVVPPPTAVLVPLPAGELVTNTVTGAGVLPVGVLATTAVVVPVLPAAVLVLPPVPALVPVLVPLLHGVSSWTKTLKAGPTSMPTCAQYAAESWSVVWRSAHPQAW